MVCPKCGQASSLGAGRCPACGTALGQTSVGVLAIDTTGLPKVSFKLEAFLNGQRQQLLLNLDAAVAGTEAPRFGPVFKDSIAVTELAATAVQITPTAGAQINPGRTPTSLHIPPSPAAKPTLTTTALPMQRRP